MLTIERQAARDPVDVAAPDQAREPVAGRICATISAGVELDRSPEVTSAWRR